MNLIKITKSYFALTVLAVGLNAAGTIPSPDSVVDEYSAMRNGVAEAKRDGRKIVLVIGAVPRERSQFKFDVATGFDRQPYIIYINEVHFRDVDGLNGFDRREDAAADWRHNFIEGCIDRPYFLEKIRSIVGPSSFDLIIPDASVGKFLEFDKTCLDILLDMLKDDGRMMFDYKKGSWTTIHSDNNIIKLYSDRYGTLTEKLEQEELIREHPRGVFNYQNIDTLKNTYKRYVESWNREVLPEGNLQLVTGIFPYWQATPSRAGSRNNWIARERTYLVMRKGPPSEPAAMDEGPRPARIAVSASSPEHASGIDEQITINGITHSRSSKNGKRLAAEVRMHLKGHIERYKMGHYIHSDFGGRAADTEENIDKLIAFFRPKES